MLMVDSGIGCDYDCCVEQGTSMDFQYTEVMLHITLGIMRCCNTFSVLVSKYVRSNMTITLPVIILDLPQQHVCMPTHPIIW